MANAKQPKPQNQQKNRQASPQPSPGGFSQLSRSWDNQR